MHFWKFFAASFDLPLLLSPPIYPTIRFSYHDRLSFYNTRARFSSFIFQIRSIGVFGRTTKDEGKARTITPVELVASPLETIFVERSWFTAVLRPQDLSRSPVQSMKRATRIGPDGNKSGGEAVSFNRSNRVLIYVSKEPKKLNETITKLSWLVYPRKDAFFSHLS